MDEDMIIPDDIQETATPQAEENIEAAEVNEVEDTKPTEETQEQTETVEQPQEQPKIKIKYNHEERELTLEEATLLAQKGMNYDKTIERLKSLETDPRFQKYEKMKQLADKYQMGDDDFLDALYNQWEQTEIQKLAQRETISEELAQRLFKLEQKNAADTQKQQEIEQKQREEQKQEVEISEFIDNYPDVKIDTVPKEVWEYRSKTGKSLTDSMFWHENHQLKNKIKVLETNLSNKSKAPVASVTSHGSTETAAEDDFLKGFNSY